MPQRRVRSRVPLRPLLAALIALASPCAGTALAQSNLALGRPASGSTPCNDQETPAKAVNGSVSGGNGDKWCSRAASKFLQVDLGASFNVSQFLVRHAGAGGENPRLNTRAFDIQVSSDGASFTTAATVADNIASVSTHSITPLQARFVRLNVTQAEQNGGGAARIYELEVLGDRGQIEPCGRIGEAEYLRVYRSSLSTWCVETGLWAQHSADIQKFFAYGDAVVTTLQQLFAVTPQGLPFTYQAEPPNGRAHTGSAFGLGMGVSGDAFYNDFQDPVTRAQVHGFWGYLLTLHEAINVWTGTVTNNWPTDWWADHRSPFPNSMDFHIMDSIGTAQNDAILKQAALAHHRRMGVPGRPGFDSEVAMFDDLFNRFGGFPAFARAFELIQRDGLKWRQVSPNPSPLLTEYVIAYVSLGMRTPTDLTQSFVAAGVGTKDTRIPPYSVSAENVGDIADAHCSINAHNPRPEEALAALKRGDFQNTLVAAACGAGCPAECGCDTTSNQCVAPWRAR